MLIKGMIREIKEILVMNQEHANLISRLRASADALAQTVTAIPSSLLDKRPAEGEWSVQEILDHTRNVVVLAYGLRLRRLLYEDNPQFSDYDEDLYQGRNLVQPLPVQETVEIIIAEHKQLARLLSALPDEAWSRTGNHPEAGSLSIVFMARRVAEHAEEHQGQIEATVKALT